MSTEGLRSVPLFAGLDEAALERIAGEMSEFDVPVGHVLIQPGREGTGLFVIDQGTVVVERDGKTVERGPGDSIGELALLNPEGVRSARVQAATPVRGWAMSRARFEDVIREEPAIALALLKVLAQRLAEAGV